MKQITKQLLLIERLDQLIRLKATGTPTQLAQRLNISDRQVTRMIAELREMGLPIKYNKKESRYEYINDVKIMVRIEVGEEIVLKIGYT